MSIPAGSPPPPTTTTAPSYTGLLAALHHSVTGGHAAAAVYLLPELSRAGLRPPFPLLSSLARLLLLRRAAPSFPSLAGRLLLYVRLAGLKRLVPCSTHLANRLLHLNFLLRRPRDARRLFVRMPHPDICSYNAMLAGYARLALAAPAAEVFASMPNRDLLSYNASMLALAGGSEMQKAVALYSELRSTSTSLGYSDQTFLALLVGCEKLMDRELARQLHAHLILHGFLSDVNIASSLVDVYIKCGCIADATDLFNEVPVKSMQMWTAIVCGYVEDDQLTTARQLFDQMPKKNILSWNALMEGYVKHGQEEEAMSIFQRLIKEGVHPDQITFSSCFRGCAAVSALKCGQQVHGRLSKTRFYDNAMILSSLIDMYSRCGYLADAIQVFCLTDQENRDTVLWNALLGALCHHGHGQEVIESFVQMIRERQKPDANTFLPVLKSCCHCNLVEEGMGFFELMTERYRIVPGEDHYFCLVDLFSCSSSHDKMIDGIKNSPFVFSKQVWETLAGNCIIHGDSESLKLIEEHLAESASQK
ncbi:pentatricopeptide repeat-containing protein At2g21090-like [Oryza brachyantha]|uniref:Pentacotripeptide-repeat region of PRORP domain-containing protein n=1 Tax=Oryza brachyantha TaxID=4533 RepID=J3N510_ORYBR|nr:pentatricopeptide repeat-containing protein At2g21090-like [Oryza brachyantha]